ncbi:sulfotransferase family protein [Nocardioides sp.]|uniref:sulfotransferase family protein n=1 Tax=Nocardioides sp. TaxID=35761 RepID=UPI0039E248CA
MTRSPQPDFLIAGAPKAGTTALHAALSQHPEIFMCSPKEPKYWLCDDAPPPHYGGPGDRHSQREWLWRRSDYEALWAPAREDQVRGESTPFYLWSRGAHRRIAASLPGVKVIAVVRDPIDRAYSNWMHLWCDGLEPIADFMSAFRLEPSRVAAGYAPFWRYRSLGLYGEQLAHLYSLIPREQVLVMRYRELVDDPAGAVDRACSFLGVATGLVSSIPRDNSRAFVAPGWRPTVFGPVIRGGALLGQFARPQMWRAAEPYLRPLLRSAADDQRPRLTPEQRDALLPAFAEDIALLQELTGDDYSVWLSPASRGSFVERSPG